MTLIEIARTIREFCETLVQSKPSRYMLHLEHEIEVLRVQNGLLQLKLEEALKPKAPPTPIKADFSQFKPIKTSWENYRDEQNALLLKQEQESQTKPESQALSN